ncbi:UNVERIFIED_CONTAM: hypothetical protein RMT77_000216 [Armadillidium vulgare]
MSHQTGICANDELLQFFGNCKSGSIRAVYVIIEDEQLSLGDYKNAKGKWDEEYDLIVLPYLKEKQPCYLLYRLDSKAHHGGFEWILISWSPDDSPVRQKMLYASTKATLKKEFGAAQIVDELFGTTKEDVCFEGFKKHRISEAAPAPLTSREEEMKEIQKLEVGADISIDSRHQTLAGVAFPLTNKAVEALQLFARGKLQYIQLKIDIESEEINLSMKSDELIVSELSNCIPEDTARYHLYRFDHSYEGDYYHSVVFIYSMPGYSCPIKERMLYSSSRNPVIEYIENVINLGLTRKLEISEGNELTKDYLLDEIHPKQNLHKPKFSKPKGPSNRGAKRLTKSPKEIQS